MAAKVQKVLFIDSNIWLDFYRARNDAGLALLRHAEAISDRIAVTYQLESEFKKNRQAAILEGLQELKSPAQIPRPAIFSDAKSVAALNKNLKEADKRVKQLKARLTKALENPAAHDVVFQTCQRIFHKADALCLERDNSLRHQIRRRAFRRFLHGCPPRKKNDTSFGDAFNWEWMVECAKNKKAELVIVSRDSDYGISFDNRTFLNDHLRQEFSERVNKQRKILLYTRLADALKHFKVAVSAGEVEAEKEMMEAKPATISTPVESLDMEAFMELIRKRIAEKVAEVQSSRPPKS